jgi:hypothetical protein
MKGQVLIETGTRMPDGVPNKSKLLASVNTIPTAQGHFHHHHKINTKLYVRSNYGWLLAVRIQPRQL